MKIKIWKMGGPQPWVGRCPLHPSWFWSRSTHAEAFVVAMRHIRVWHR